MFLFTEISKSLRFSKPLSFITFTEICNFSRIAGKAKRINVAGTIIMVPFTNHTVALKALYMRVIAV